MITTIDNSFEVQLYQTLDNSCRNRSCRPEYGLFQGVIASIFYNSTFDQMVKFICRRNISSVLTLPRLEVTLIEYYLVSTFS